MVITPNTQSYGHGSTPQSWSKFGCLVVCPHLQLQRHLPTCLSPLNLCPWATPALYSFCWSCCHELHCPYCPASFAASTTDEARLALPFTFVVPPLLARWSKFRYLAAIPHLWPQGHFSAPHPPYFPHLCPFGCPVLHRLCCPCQSVLHWPCHPNFQWNCCRGLPKPSKVL